jgi:hypothetical protein
VKTPVDPVNVLRTAGQAERSAEKYYGYKTRLLLNPIFGWQSNNDAFASGVDDGYFPHNLENHAKVDFVADPYRCYSNNYYFNPSVSHRNVR